MPESLALILARLLSAFVVSWIARKLWKHAKHPLDILPGPPSNSILSGNIRQLFALDGWDYYNSVLTCYGRATRITGAFGERLLLTFDPKALHHILVKDQHMYETSAGFIKRNEVFFGEGLLATLGEKHRRQRKMMIPVFSIKHMREMIPLFYEVAGRLRTTLKAKVEKGSQEIDILRWMSRTALELIGQGGLGYSFDTLTGDQEDHPYAWSIKRFAPLTGGPFGFFMVRFLFPFAARFDFPRVKRFIVEHIPWKRVQDLKKVIDIIHSTSSEVIQKKKDALESSDPAIAREMLEKKDIISILMRANAQAEGPNRLTDEEVFGQVSSFVIAAMETTSSALSRILQLLSTHQDNQARLSAEIREAQKDGQLDYDQLVSLPYLDAVCRETLRLYPPVNTVAPRTARKDMILPLSKPILGTDGKELTEIIIPNGTNIFISVLGANTNAELWGEDAQEWKPERWLAPLPKTVVEAHLPGIYSNVLTFLGGGRACIGFKFSQLEMKVVLAVLLSTFKFDLAPNHEITWKMTGISGPYVENLDPSRPQLPVIMSLLD